MYLFRLFIYMERQIYIERLEGTCLSEQVLIPRNPIYYPEPASDYP